MKPKPIEDLALKVVDPVVADKVTALYLAAREAAKAFKEHMSEHTEASSFDDNMAMVALESAIDDLERAAP